MFLFFSLARVAEPIRSKHVNLMRQGSSRCLQFLRTYGPNKSGVDLSLQLFSVLTVCNTVDPQRKANGKNSWILKIEIVDGDFTTVGLSHRIGLPGSIACIIVNKVPVGPIHVGLDDLRLCIYIRGRAGKKKDCYFFNLRLLHSIFDILLEEADH